MSDSDGKLGKTIFDFLKNLKGHQLLEGLTGSKYEQLKQKPHPRSRGNVKFDCINFVNP